MGRDKDIKNRIKKVVPQNEWLVNVTKSLGFTSLEVIRDLMPNTYSSVDWNKDTIVNTATMIQGIRDNNGIRNAFNKQFKNIPHLKIANDALQNALSDIKSGNLYNQNRMEGLDDNGEFNFDEFSFDDGDGPVFIDDDGSDTESNDTGEKSRTPVTIINTMPLAKSIASSTEANINAIAAVSEQNVAIETEKMLLNKQTFNATMNALESMNQNLGLLVQFNADSTAKYQAAALKYFEESLNALTKPKEEENKKNVRKLFNPFTTEGGLKFDEYGEIIKKNLTDIKDENLILSASYEFLKDPEFLREMAKNPIGTLMTFGINKLIPKAFKSSLGKLDKNMNAVLPALLARINTFEDSDDPLLQTLNKIFGSQQRANYEVDLGDYNKGAISWDGESKKALVEVIPAYLRRIESILGNTEERFFNYDTGKFDGIANIEKEYKKSLAKAETSGFFNVKSEISDVVDKLDLSQDAKKQFFEDIEEYFRAMVKKGHMISHEDNVNDAGFVTNELVNEGLFNLDINRTDLVKKVLSLLPESVLTEMSTVAISDSIEKTEKHMNKVRDNPALSGYSYLYNDLDENGVARYNKSKLTTISEKDRYGLNHLDYLRDIRSALINGIKVFPDYRRRFVNGVPNSNLLNKERIENEEYEAKLQEEAAANENVSNIRHFNRGRSINDAANMTENELDELFPDRRNKELDEDAGPIDKLNNSVEHLIYEILYGKVDYRDKALKKLKKMYGKSKPMIESMRGFFSDTVKAFKSFFTGQGYVTSDGVTVEPTESVISNIKASLFGIKDKFTDSTKPGGMFHNFFEDFMEGFNKFKVSLFGEKKLDDGKETFQDLMGKIKQRLPKALAYGYGGAVIKTIFASNLGLLGNFLLPGGPIGAMLTGTTLGFLKQSETFNRYMFGEQDEDGNRTGGLISKAWQDKYQEYKGVIGKGAGLGILASLFLPGGPVAGAILGIGTGIASRNEAFQEFLYGKDYKEQDKKSLMNGAFGKALKKLSGGGETDDPKLAKFLGATGLGVGIAQGVGLLPSFLLPGGPIMGAMLGLAGGIAASSNKFQEFLLGEKDIDGQRYGGLLTKAANWFSLTFAQPLKLKFTEFNDFLYGMFRKHIFDPLARSFEPIIHGVKNLFINAKDSLVEAFTRITHPIVDAFKEAVIQPIAKGVNAILKPIKWILKKTLGLMTNTLVGIITSPIRILGRTADKFNEYSAVRQEKFRRRREYDKNTPKEERNYYDRKRAGKLTKEEKKEAIEKGVSYRKGKTWGEKKKEQKDAYKEEMDKRKERRAEMKRQFEEDKNFAKENGFKYKSKKQKEKREQELKEKEAWMQEQQLMQSQDTGEKVSKIADNVVQFPEQNDKVVNRLDEVKETLKEGFNKLANKMGFSDDSDYGQVTDEHLAPIYDFLDEKQKRRPETVTKEPENYGQVTDEHLATIHNFIDKENAKEEKPTTLKDAFDGFKSEVKDLVKTIKESRDAKTTTPSSPDPNRERKWITEKDITIDPEKLHDPELQDKVAKLNKKFKQRKSNVIDFNKFLEDNDRSHKDGLDLVPNDGYIAELHEGEMVVPEKPAGKLRGLMNKAGKGFKGLTDILSETSEEDIDHRDEDPGMVEDSLLHGTIKGLRGMAGLLGNVTSFMGNIGNFFGKKISKDEERDREDNALGVTDDEADRLKEMEDRVRYEHASRKNVDFIQEKIAAEEKEKEEKSWKEKMLAAVQNMGGFAASAGTSLFDLIKSGIDSLLGGFSNLGSVLGSLAIPAAVAALMKMGDKYQESEEYIQGRTDADGELVTDNYDLVKGRTLISARNQLFIKPAKTIKKKLIDPIVKVGKGVFKGINKTGKKIYNSKLGQKFLQPIGEKYKTKMTNIKDFGQKALQPITDKFTNTKEYLKNRKVIKATETADNVIDFASAKAAKEAGEKAVTKNAGKVVNIADAKIAKGATETSSGKALSKIAGEAADEGGLIGKLVNLGKQALAKLCDYVAEKFPKIPGLADNLIKSADNIFGTLLKFADDIMPKFAKKIAAVFAKIGIGAASAFTIDAVFAVGDLLTGFTAGNAGNLFGVSTENVDARMRIISSVIQAVFNFNFMAIISLINEITNMMFNFNFLRNIAIWLYNLTGGKNDFSSRITSKEIDSCTSIEQALQIMGITDPNEIAMLKDGNDWKDFSKLENKEFGGVISATEQMELARLQYNLANGTKLNSQAFIDKQSKTFGSKVMDWGKKLFTRETAQQKIHKLETKATDKRAKAEEYRKKSAESNNIFGKAWNNSMAWLNEKSAQKAEKKAAKKKAEAPEKQAKYQAKADYHTEKAATATGVAKWYHNWRAKANTKKVDRYTLKDGQVVNETELQGTTAGASTDTTTEESLPPILTPEEVLANNDIPEGEIVYDAYRRAYDHNGNYMGDAGMGDGETFEQEMLPEQQLITAEPLKKKDSILKKATKGLLTALPGGIALKTGVGLLSSLFGKNNRPEDYRMVPIMDENGNIVSYQSQLVDETTEIEGFNAENLKVEEMGRNTQVIPQVDQNGNVVSYTTVDKSKPKTGFLSKLASGIGSIFGLGGSSTTSNSTSSSVDNSSSVTNNTGDTYNTTTNEVDTSMFGPLADAINSLVGSQGNNNIDEEGNVKTGGILKAIMDPMGYLAKKLTTLGINVYEATTGKEADDEKINQGLSIFNMLRNPFGYLYSVVKDKMDPNDDGKKDKTFKEATKEVYEEGKEKVVKTYNDTKEWGKDKYNQGKEWGKDKYNQGKEWVVDSFNKGRETWDKFEQWGKDKYNQGKEWFNKEKNQADDFADIMMGDNNAKGNIFTAALSNTGDIGTAIWNKLVPDDAKLGEGELADFFATMINKMIVKPFQILTDPVTKKFDEAKEAVSNWVEKKKTDISDWYVEKIKEPLAESKERAKKTQQAIFDDMKRTKDGILNWYNKEIKEPWDKSKERAKKTQQAIFDDMKKMKDDFVNFYNTKIKEPWDKSRETKKKIQENVFNWVKGIKNGIVDAFNKKIKEPVTEALTPVTSAISGAWSSLKSSFEPIAGIFSAIKEGRWGDIASIVKNTGQEGRDNANADADNAGTSGPKSTIAMPRSFRPVKHNITSDELVSIDRRRTRPAGPRMGGIDDRPGNRSVDGPPTNRPATRMVRADNRPGNRSVDGPPTNRPAGPMRMVRAEERPGNRSVDGPPGSDRHTFGKSIINDKFVHYTQSDERWSREKIGRKTMKDAGCGPTSLAMAISQMTGEQVTPDTIARLGEDHLPGYSRYSLFPSIAGRLNMNYSEGNDPRFITNNLKRGIPVVLSGRTNVQGTPYTSEGHVVTASHMKGNMVYIQDPRGRQYSGYYPLNKLTTGLNKGMIVTPSTRTDVSRISSGRAFTDLTLDRELYKQDLGVYGDIGEYESLNDDRENLGETGAGQITMADRVLSYARAFLNNTSKFSYSQPRRLQIDTNKSSSKGCGADCSSFVSHVLSRAGDVNIYGTTSQTFWDSVGTKVSEPQIGDVVCQEGHVGLYSGDGNYIHMSGRKAGIKESKAIQNGNNKHRGYKRVLKNPSQMVDPTVPNANTFLGTVVGTSSGHPVGGGSGGPQASLDKALLIGDSLTVGIKDTLEGKYPNAKAMGKGGKWAKHWLEDLGSLPSDDSVSTVIQWLGINGVHANESNMKDSQTLLTKLKEKYPGKPIFNMRIFPTTEKYSYGDYTGEWWRKLSQEFNEGMSSWAGSNGVTQLDATSGFIQEDGYLDPSKAVDGIHFTTDGYKGVLANIESQINNYNSSNTGAVAGQAQAPGLDQMGVFGKLSTVGNAMITALYNGKSFGEVYNSMLNPVTVAPTDGTTPTDGTNPDIGDISDTAKAVYTFLTGKGYTPEAACGILGNMAQESGVDPTRVQTGSGHAAGICQWESYKYKKDRWKGLSDYAASKGKDWKDLQSQLEWLDMELAGKDSCTLSYLKSKGYGGYEGFKQINDVERATLAFEECFERANPAKANMPRRYNEAKKYYQQFKGASAGMAGPEEGAGGGFTMATAADPTGDAKGNPETMNGWAYYRQGDPQWQEDINNKKIGPSGCGMASHAMMLTTMFGKKVTPVTVGKWARANNLWNNGMDWGMPSAIAKKLGLKIVASKSDYNGLPDGAFDEVVSQIKSGYPVVLSGLSNSSSNTNSPFTSGGHIVLAVGVDGSGNLIINDPRGPHVTKAYTKSGVMSAGIGMRGYWAFDSTPDAKLPEDWISGDYTGSPGVGTTPTDGTAPAAVATPGFDQMGVFAKLGNVGNIMITALYNGKDFADVQNGTAVDTTTGTPGSPDSNTGVTGKGNFPKYALNEQQIKGIANILQHEQPGIEGRMAEASLMANLVDKTGDEKATVDNLIKKATGGWFAKGKSRFNNPGNPEQISIDAARTVLVEGKRTLPRYVDEHDCFSDLEWVKNDGVSFKASDRSQYKPHVTKLKNIYGASGTFHSFPNSKSDPFYYTSEELRQKWGDDCYSPSSAASSNGDAGQGDGKTYYVKPKSWTSKPVPKVSKPIAKPIINVNENIRKYDYDVVKEQHRKSMESITGKNRIDVSMQRDLDAINRRIDTQYNNMNSNDPQVYMEVLKLIMKELHAINGNTAETANNIKEIAIVSANEPVKTTGGNGLTTADTYKSGSVNENVLRQINTSTGYDMARQIAGYKQK